MPLLELSILTSQFLTPSHILISLFDLASPSETVAWTTLVAPDFFTFHRLACRAGESCSALSTSKLSILLAAPDLSSLFDLAAPEPSKTTAQTTLAGPEFLPFHRLVRSAGKFLRSALAMPELSILLAGPEFLASSTVSLFIPVSFLNSTLNFVLFFAFLFLCYFPLCSFKYLAIDYFTS